MVKTVQSTRIILFDCAMSGVLPLTNAFFMHNALFLLPNTQKNPFCNIIECYRKDCSFIITMNGFFVDFIDLHFRYIIVRKL